MTHETPDDDGRGIRPEAYPDILGKAFLNYAMSVIVSRALPDVRDGLKPVHRRILYAMQEGGYTANKSKSKCARIVGDTMGKYHPHGDLAIYDAMVRLAQPWKQRHVLIDSQGNFGNIDGDRAAAMRYTEARLSRLGHEITGDVGDHKSGVVDFRPNYDGKTFEPIVLPAGFPNILVNGGSGIAVGMATEIPPHNLSEAIDAAIVVLDKPGATLDDILAVMPGPDLPTRGTLMGRSRIRECYETGRGTIPVMGKASIVDEKEGRGRVQRRIVISEIPYGLNKEDLVGKIGELLNAKVIEGVSDLRDESSGNDGVRIVLDVRPDAQADVIVNMLKKHTQFQGTLPWNSNVLDSRGKPVTMGVVQILQEFVVFRREIVGRRSRKDLDRHRDEQIKQIALFAAVSQIDEVIRLIRTSSDSEQALGRLKAMVFPVDEDLGRLIREADPDAVPGGEFSFSQVQAEAVFALRLSRLTGLAREEIAKELQALAVKVRGLIEIIENPAVLDTVVRNEMLAIRAKHGNGSPRMTEIVESDADDIDDESLIERKDVVVTLTRSGYVKRTELSAYRSQRRGGKGRTGMETRDEDVVIEARVCTTRTPLLVFTSRGQVHALKAWRLPDAAPNAKGRPIVNFLKLNDGEKVTALVPMPEDREGTEHLNLVFVTENGSVRRNLVSDFLDIRKGGKIAMSLEEDGQAVDRLMAVLLTDDAADLLVATSTGLCSRFAVGDIRLFQSRQSTGVRGIQFKRDGDKVVDACILRAIALTPLERDVYLAGGSKVVREASLTNEAGERLAQPPSLSLRPGAEPERHVASLSATRMQELREAERFLLTVTANGYGKRSSTHEYRATSRGTSGFAAAVVNDLTGTLVNCLLADDTDQLVLITDGGQTIRLPVDGITVLGRDTRGVKLLDVPTGQSIASVALAPSPDRDEDAAEGVAPAAEPVEG